MTREWRLARLGDVIERVFDRRGVTPQKLGSAFQSAGHRVISAKHIKGGRIDLLAGEDRFVDEVTYRRWMSSPLLSGDVLVTSEAPLGEVAYVHEDRSWCIGQRLFALRPASSKMNGRFLYFALQSPAVADDIQRRATGTTAQGIRQPELLNVQVPVPDLAEQQAIANTLGGLVDKIDLNRRTSDTLEAMARALFKSWFVDFDPVRAKKEGRKPDGMDAATAALFPDDFEDSQIGPIPRGWEAGTLGDVIDIFDSLRVPLSAREREARKGQYPYYGATSVMDYVDAFLFEGAHVLVGEDGSVMHDDGTPFVQYVWGKFWVNNHAHVLRGKRGVSPEHLALLLRSCNIAPFVTGAVQAKLNQGNLCRVPVIVAPESISSVFGKVISSLYARYREQAAESQSLTSLRDALLPKLLSGELRVPEAERIVAEAV